MTHDLHPTHLAICWAFSPGRPGSCVAPRQPTTSRQAAWAGRLVPPPTVPTSIEGMLTDTWRERGGNRRRAMAGIVREGHEKQDSNAKTRLLNLTSPHPYCTVQPRRAWIESNQPTKSRAGGNAGRSRKTRGSTILPTKQHHFKPKRRRKGQTIWGTAVQRRHSRGGPRCPSSP